MIHQGFVYVLASQNRKRYYIGSTNNPERRLNDHNQEKVISTRNKGPWKIVLLQQCRDEKHAKQVEYMIKKLKSRTILETMIKDQKIRLANGV